MMTVAQNLILSFLSENISKRLQQNILKSRKNLNTTSRMFLEIIFLNASPLKEDTDTIYLFIQLEKNRKMLNESIPLKNKKLRPQHRRFRTETAANLRMIFRRNSSSLRKKSSRIRRIVLVSQFSQHLLFQYSVKTVIVLHTVHVACLNACFIMSQ